MFELELGKENPQMSHKFNTNYYNSNFNLFLNKNIEKERLFLFFINESIPD
jgi:hypothetical protein